MTIDERLHILTQVSQAFVFLHEECDIPTAHLRLSSNSVLLDRHGNCKLTDFRSSIEFPRSDHQELYWDGEVGAYGYCDPFEESISLDCDKYAYGVLSLEVLFNLPAAGDFRLDGRCKILFPSLREEPSDDIYSLGILQDNIYPREFLRRWIKLARSCLDDDMENRPSFFSIYIEMERFHRFVTVLCGICTIGFLTCKLPCGHPLCDKCVEICKHMCPFCRRSFSEFEIGLFYSS